MASIQGQADVDANTRMATRKPAAAIENIDDDDFEPSPRDPLHQHQDLCKLSLDNLAPAAPLQIRPSTISTGSGLFTAAEIESGHEIYHVYPMMKALDAGNDSFCHYCFEDTQELLGGTPKAKTQTKACGGCKVARFCSKECQRSAWSLYHNDECKILRDAPKMTAQHLLAHRLLFWQNRGYITNSNGKSLVHLETHFSDYSKDPERATPLMDVAMAVREATGSKVNLATAWKLVPAMRVNCVRLRAPSKKDSVGYAFDMATAMINHSCKPNAHVFFEGQKLWVRSLQKIPAGGEITICYLDPTLDVAARRSILKRDHFFECRCPRCKFELAEQLSVFKTGTRLTAFYQAQREVLTLIGSAVRAAKYPGAYPDLDNLATVETRLRTITAGVSWPETMEPLPSARLSLAMLYLEQGKPVPALRNAIKGRFITSTARQDLDAEWVNEMLDLVTVLIVAGSMPPDSAAFEDKTFPSLDDIRAVTFGNLVALCQGATSVFGGDSEYAKAMQNMLGVMLAKKPGAKMGTQEFADEFTPANLRVLVWAGIAKTA